MERPEPGKIPIKQNKRIKSGEFSSGFIIYGLFAMIAFIVVYGKDYGMYIGTFLLVSLSIFIIIIILGKHTTFAKRLEKLASLLGKLLVLLFYIFIILYFVNLKGILDIY